MGVHLEAEVGLTIDGMHDAVHGALKKHHNERAKPSYLRRAAAALSDGVNLNVLDLGAPPNGRMWQVIYLTLYGTDDHTAVATIVGGVYVGNPSSLSLPGLVIPSLAFPSSTQLSDKVLWVHSNENLCVKTSIAGTAGQQLGVNASILEWRDHEISMRTGR